MIDKSKRKATAERHGDMIVIRMTGGPDCLWLNMYLDTAAWGMTCDSDIGSYAYHWGRSASKTETFAEFCCRWLEDDAWLLRKCIGERHGRLSFRREETEDALREKMIEYGDGDEDFDIDDFDDALNVAASYDADAHGWALAMQMEAERRDIDLPEEWYECIVEDYTPWQKRFAEICREVIVPELEKLETPKEEP